MGDLSQLEPREVWKHFEQLCAIPRPSYHEEAAARYVMQEARRLGCASRQDEAGTPYGVTVDSQTAEDGTVTVRDRDSMAQDRVAGEKVVAFLADKIATWTRPETAD